MKNYVFLFFRKLPDKTCLRKNHFFGHRDMLGWKQKVQKKQFSISSLLRADKLNQHYFIIDTLGIFFLKKKMFFQVFLPTTDCTFFMAWSFYAIGMWFMKNYIFFDFQKLPNRMCLRKNQFFGHRDLLGWKHKVQKKKKNYKNCMLRGDKY